MRVALEALDVPVGDDVLVAVDREVRDRVSSSVFTGVENLRLRLHHVKGALLCVAAVGFAGGDLVTSTSSSSSPLEAIVGALDGLPDRIDRIHRSDRRPNSAPTMAVHRAAREELKRLLESA
jgi:hypothetical protein